MTAHTPRILTDAETELLKVAPHSEALAGLGEFGLPTRRVEAWHYTDLRAQMPKGLAPMAEPQKQESKEALEGHERLMDSIRLPFINGHFSKLRNVQKTLEDDLPKSVTIKELDAAELAATTSFGEDKGNAVGWISSAFATSGVSIHIKSKATVERPIGLSNLFVKADNGIAATRHSVTFKAGSTATIIDRTLGPNDSAYLNSSVVDLTLEEGANATWIIDQEEGDAATRLARLSVRLEKDAKLTLFIMNAGGKLVRQELDFVVVGEGADLNIHGINMVGAESHVDVTSRIEHRVPNTTATETFRNVVTGRGQGVFQGQIKVAQPAQLTDARMACNTLLLSDDCGFSAKPELEIFADDVQCAHGATVTDLEESYMFYLMARGISEVNARRMLIRAFVAEVVEELEEDELVEALEARVDAWMSVHV